MQSLTDTSDVSLWDHYQIHDPEKFAGGHARQRALVRHIRHLAPSGKLLEIGFGDGYLLRSLASFYECYGADISREHVEQMASKLPEVSFATVPPGGNLPYTDESFDVFLASEVLEHMDDGQLHTTVSEMHRVLRPGGFAVLTFPARENLKDNESFCPSCGTIFHKWGHKQSWDRKKIARIFESFETCGISERLFVGSQLNVFGKFEAYTRILLSKVRPVSRMTYLVTLRK